MPDYTKYTDDQLIEYIKHIEEKDYTFYKYIFDEIRKRNLKLSEQNFQPNISSLTANKIFSKEYIIFNVVALVLLLILYTIAKGVIESEELVFAVFAFYYFSTLFSVIFFAHYQVYKTFKNRFRSLSIFGNLAFGTYFFLDNKLFYKNIIELKPNEFIYIKNTLSNGFKRALLQFLFAVIILIILF